MSRPQSTYPQQAGRPADNYPPYEPRYPGRGGPSQPGGPQKSRKGVIIATVAAAVVAGSVIGLGGAQLFGGGDDEIKTAPVRSMAEIAKTIGCKTEDVHKNADFSQAACTVGSDRMTILTFESNQKMTEWITEAEGYGGAYLVGTKWLVTSQKADTLDRYVDDLGGQIMLDNHYVK
ncbi:hypothetical protein [Cryptosporangium phraense]|uniref:Uncharacterized protein n=1 Tax=Cryptosporangium phraense TaxID=2593070 RepID=A0A545AVR9_9ACTN|nr:hypothetical protein [Cryptosporangium phraense]TQS45413.1 hypothetical protein FL583_10045 [Cryptosporangium phraense]